MKRNIFTPADILLPAGGDFTLWSTVACDQFTSDPEYWDQVALQVGDSPSTLHMMLPEAWLNRAGADEAPAKINATMKRYLESGVFQTVKDAYIYVERSFADGTLRRGLVGAIDLNEFDYSDDSMSLVHGTEHTVPERLPARVEIRKQASLEMPHIMLFIDDREDAVMASAAKGAQAPLYDFDLMCGGGHLKGSPITGFNAMLVTAVLDELTDKDLLEQKYGFSQGAMVYAVGDGNHSLAAAKKCWEEIAQTLTAEERETHPARYALVELVNIHDAGVTLHPIHRAVFGIDAADFVQQADSALFSATGTPVTLVTERGSVTKYVSDESIGMVIEDVDAFCQEYAKAHSAVVDYIHGDAEAAQYGAGKGNAAILLPGMEKQELFTSVMDTGVFCKKSFSIGEASEKRYYMECRKIQA